MSTRGFTLVELLLALVLGLVAAAGAAALAAATRRTFLVEPEVLDVTQRARVAADILITALSAAGGGQALGDGVNSPDATAPPVRPLAALEGSQGSRFAAVSVWRALTGASGRLEQPQPGVSGSLVLDRSGDAVCPALPEVCGFRAGDTALITDGRGRVDAFVIDGVSVAAGALVPARPLTYAYPAGAWIVAARAERIGLSRQPDGSFTLVRLTAAGAREPLLDGLVDLEFDVWGVAEAPWVRDGIEDGLSAYGLAPPPPAAQDPAGLFAAGTHCMVARVDGTPYSTLVSRSGSTDGLTRLSPADLDDGPWCPYAGAPGAFDADVYRIRRLDIRLRVEAQPPEFRGSDAVLFRRRGQAAHDPGRWVPDRSVAFSVAVGK